MKKLATILAAVVLTSGAVLVPATVAAQADPAPATPKALDAGPALDQTKDYYAAIITNVGTLKLKLFATEAPVTVANFVNLAEGTREFVDPRTRETVKRPFYNGVIFHRCIPNFMIQGGDPTGTGMGGPGYDFQDEVASGRTFDKPGLLAMANRGPGTNGSQFFITEAATNWLNGKHTIFGELVEPEAGMAIVKKITSAPQDPRSNKPLTAIRMERVEIIRVPKGAPLTQVTWPGSVVPAAGDAKSATESKPAAEAKPATEQKAP